MNNIPATTAASWLIAFFLLCCTNYSYAQCDSSDLVTYYQSFQPDYPASIPDGWHKVQMETSDCRASTEWVRVENNRVVEIVNGSREGMVYPPYIYSNVVQTTERVAGKITNGRAMLRWNNKIFWAYFFSVLEKVEEELTPPVLEDQVKLLKLSPLQLKYSYFNEMVHESYREDMKKNVVFKFLKKILLDPNVPSGFYLGGTKICFSSNTPTAEELDRLQQANDFRIYESDFEWRYGYEDKFTKAAIIGYAISWVTYSYAFDIFPKNHIQTLNIYWCEAPVSEILYSGFDVKYSELDKLEVINFRRPSSCEAPLHRDMFYGVQENLERLKKAKDLKRIDFSGSNLGVRLQDMGKKERENLLAEFQADHPACILLF